MRKPNIRFTQIKKIGKSLYFECYLDLSLDDEKYKDLKMLLDKNKSKFKDM